MKRVPAFYRMTFEERAAHVLAMFGEVLVSDDFEDPLSKKLCEALGICNRWMHFKLFNFPKPADSWIFGPAGREDFGQ